MWNVHFPRLVASYVKRGEEGVEKCGGMVENFRVRVAAPIYQRFSHPACLQTHPLEVLFYVLYYLHGVFLFGGEFALYLGDGV